MVSKMVLSWVISQFRPFIFWRPSWILGLLGYFQGGSYLKFVMYILKILYAKFGAFIRFVTIGPIFVAKPPYYIWLKKWSTILWINKIMTKISSCPFQNRMSVREYQNNLFLTIHGIYLNKAQDPCTGWGLS